VFGNVVLGKTLGSKRHEVTGSGEDGIMRRFMVCLNIIRVIKSRKMSRAGACSMYGKQGRCKQGFGVET
jgi:hypothetical protein